MALRATKLAVLAAALLISLPLTNLSQRFLRVSPTASISARVPITPAIPFTPCKKFISLSNQLSSFLSFFSPLTNDLKSSKNPTTLAWNPFLSFSALIPVAVILLSTLSFLSFFPSLVLLPIRLFPVKTAAASLAECPGNPILPLASSIVLMNVI